MSTVTGIDPSAIAALWVGFSTMLLFTAYFMKASYHSDSKHVLYHFITAIITMICCFAYLIMALMSEGIGTGGEDLLWVHYADWLITTPMLLIDLGMLAGMRVAEVVFLAITDALMIGAGYAGIVTVDPRGSWPFFMFSLSCFFVIIVRLLLKLRQLTIEHSNTAEATAFKFLAMWTSVLWTLYPILYVLHQTNVMSLTTEIIVYCVLDFLAKGTFGAILVGSREVLEGEQTPLALLAMALTGINPTMRRASQEDMSSAIAEYMKTRGASGAASPGLGAGLMAGRRGSLDQLMGGRRASLDNLKSPIGAELVVPVNNPAHAQAADTAASTSPLSGVLAGLLAQQQATGGNDPAINAQVQAVLAAMSPHPSAALQGARKSSANSIISSMMANAAAAGKTPGVPGTVVYRDDA